MPQLNGQQVGTIGFGLMGLTAKEIPEDQAFATMRKALERGCNVWNGGEFYGPPERNSLTLLKRYFAKYPEDAAKVSLNIKGCVLPGHKVAASREQVFASVNNCIDMLGDAKKIDVFEPARRDPNVPLEETLGAFEELIKEGKIGGVALSEVSAKSIREAAAIAKIQSVEIELSLWATDPLTNGILHACKELDIPVLAYGPVGQGMLAGKYKSFEDIPADDRRRDFPRFQRDNFEKNLDLLRALEKFAKNKNCTPAQLAIGWVLAISKRPDMPVIIPIPGATTAERVEENSTIVGITDEDMQEIDTILASFEVAGTRYPEQVMHMTNT
ncbi:aldo keto reductase [Diplodia corticola]|uniref:Aldo keto reductase n=1 Tax=Diplodia corticola TaxID=236234 RepID=A0A1J9R0J3_9PEZI|nr:aldo keto reductase [Diplodia corticola]OJD33770.1 aldo keto reductase [Diplodia corticola]